MKTTININISKNIFMLVYDLIIIIYFIQIIMKIMVLLIGYNII